MASYNKVILIGNLTRDPDLRSVPSSGMAVTDIGMAINGFKEGDVTFVDVTLWDKQAELVADYLVKGDPIMIEGRLTMDQWEDRETGQPRSKMKVTADRMQFIGPRKEGANTGPATSQPDLPTDDQEDIPW